jgi:hypothetical protein
MTQENGMTPKKGGFGHEKPNEGETNDWITPKWIIDAFDSKAGDEKGRFFDLDPCISLTQPWLTARHAYGIEQDGLAQSWWGTVYCNPPYGNNVGAWVQRMAEHRNGVMLIFARLETAAWFNGLWDTADAFLFPEGRIAFYEFLCECGLPRSLHISSKRKSLCSNFRNTGRAVRGHEAGAPSVFVAWGVESYTALLELCDGGMLDDRGVLRRSAFLGKALCTGARV